MTQTIYHKLPLLLFLAIMINSATADPAGKSKHISIADSLKHLYPFLNTDSNKISGNPGALAPFFKKLDEIKKGSNEQVVVVHIGDSHVQPGCITAPLRKKLQDEYGNAGRGLIFPYRVAKTNGPDGYISQSDSPWTACRIASRKQFCPSGISGFTLFSDRKESSFRFEFKTPDIYGNGINMLTIFHGNRDSTCLFTIQNTEDSSYIKANDSTSKLCTGFVTARQPASIEIKAHSQDTLHRSATFYGLSVQGSRPGVVVHTIGVNGAMFSDYLHSSQFTDQLAILKPDLIIFSLGTNEAVNAKTYTPDSLYQVLDSLASTLLKKGIGASVLFTTPPAIFKGVRKNRRVSYKPNPNAEMVRNTIIRFAHDKNLPYWDWFQIMGGAKSMAKWKSKKMTDRRYIHFSTKGYTIQGLLMKEAIWQGSKLANW